MIKYGFPINFVFRNPPLVFLLLLFSLVDVLGQSSAPQNQSDYLLDVRPTTSEIIIDGDLKEEVWKNAALADNFWVSYPVDHQQVPDELQTEVRMTYDDQYMYFGITCYGDNDYVIQTLKRDKDIARGDGFGLVIDPVNAKTNGFAFGVNAAGAQTEVLLSGLTGNRNNRGPSSVNSAWDNKWFSEVKSYPDRWTIEFAIPFKSLRFKEDISTWGINFFRWESKTNSVHTWAPVPIEFWELDLGYTGALHWEKPPKRVKSNVTVIPYALGAVGNDYETEPTSSLNDAQAGVDAKIAVTSSMNFDLTVNPNFSQVDVDQQVTNLSLFNIRFPERRLFFLENSDVFEDFGIPPMRPFFSRTIGLDADRNPIPILYGARLSGNINNKLRMGLMNLQTKETTEYLSQNYTSFAFHQQVFSRSIVKGYFHNRTALNSPVEDYNRNAGLEFIYRSTDGRTQAFGGGGKSFTPGLESQDYFYNVGAGYYNKSINLYGNLSGVGNNYVTDMGFVQGNMYYDAVRDTSIRVGYHHWYSNVAYTFYPKNEKIISHKLSNVYIVDVDSAMNLLNTQVRFSYDLNRVNTSSASISYQYREVALLFPFSFLEDEFLEPGMYDNSSGQVNFNSDQRKTFVFSSGVMVGSFYGGIRTRYRVGLKYRVQPWGNFSLRLEQNDLYFPKPYSDGRFLLISPRMEINFSKSVFWTTFVQYNTQADNFNLNSRLQWRFLPMSDVFLVYSDNYALEFWGPKSRALVLKVNYWLNL